MDLFKRIQDLSAVYDDDGPSSTVQESRPMFNNGGRIGYKDGPKFNVQASGSKSGKQQIANAPKGITSDKELINAILTLDIPLTEKVNLIGNLQYGKFRDKIEYKNNEIFLDDPKSYRDRNIGLDYNRDGEGFSGSATVGDRGPAFNIKYKKSFADGGMLVKPNADGSRPGYSGERDFVNLNDIKKYNKNLLDKSIFVATAPGRTGANQADPITLRNIFNVVEKTQGGDVLINNFKKNPTSENFLKLRTRRKNRLAFEREQALPPEQKAELRKKQLIAEKKWRASGKGQSYYNELLAKDGIFPARTAQERVWRDIYRASKQSKEDNRFKIKYPKNIKIDPETNLPKKVKAKSGKYYIPWDRYYKNISFYDTQTKSTIKFGKIREWMKNNIKGGGKKYDNAVQNYNIRQNIADFDVDGRSLGSIAKERKTGIYSKKLTTPAAVNHRSGLNNFWDTEITTSTGNSQLNDKVQSKISAYKNASNPNIKNTIMKQMKAEINKIKGGATLVIDGKTIGKEPTLRKVSNALSNELNVNLLKLAGTIDPKCRTKAVEGGRMGFQDGLSAEVCLGKAKQIINKGLKNGFKEGAEAMLATKILQAGRGLKDMFALRNILGPAAVGFTVAAEAGLVGYDMLSKGKSFKEAVGDSLFNYALGDKTQIDNKKLRYQGYKDAGVDANQIGKIAAYENAIDEMNNTFGEFNEENRLYNIAVNQKGKGRIPEQRYLKQKQKQAENFYNQADKNKALIQDLARTQTEDRLDKAIDPMVPALMSDADAKRKAMQMTKPSTVAFGNFMDTVFPKGFLSDTTYAEDREKAINYMPAVQEYYRSNQFAGGGIANLAGVDKGPPPQSGPNSQGLRGLLKRGKNT
jgi:hypothetical protein